MTLVVKLRAKHVQVKGQFPPTCQETAGKITKKRHHSKIINSYTQPKNHPQPAQCFTKSGISTMVPSQRLVSKLQLSAAEVVIIPLHKAKGKHPRDRHPAGKYGEIAMGKWMKHDDWYGLVEWGFSVSKCSASSFL